MSIFSLADEPDHWRRCFGLTDNPFAPEHDTENLKLAELGLEVGPLCPHRDGYDTLFPAYFAMLAGHFQEGINRCHSLFRASSLVLKTQGLIALVHGSQGSGKTSFSNLCRFGLREPFPAGISFDINCSPEGGTIAEQTTRIEDKLKASDRSPTSRQPALILVENLNLSTLRTAGFEANQPFEFLSSIANTLRRSAVPLIFATSWDGDLILAFARRPRADTTASTSVEINELNSAEVLEYIKSRVPIFRTEALNPTLQYFPFDASSIAACFDDLTSSGKGSLPFRNVNRLLAGALRMKKDEIMNQTLRASDFRPDLPASERNRRLIGKSEIQSVVEQLIGD